MVKIPEFVNWEPKEFETSVIFDNYRKSFFSTDSNLDAPKSFFSADLNANDLIIFRWVNTKKYSGAESFFRREIAAIKNVSNIKATYLIIEQDGTCCNLNKTDKSEKGDFIHGHSNIFELLNRIKVGKNHFVEVEQCKLIVVDHAENIKNREEIYNLIAKLNALDKGRYILVMLNKIEEAGSQNLEGFWKDVYRNKPQAKEYNFLGRQQSENYFPPFDDDEIKKIINGCGLFTDEKKRKINSIGKFPEYLHRAYYLDRFLCYLCNNDVPEKIENFSVLNALYGEGLDKIDNVDFDDFKKTAEKKGVFSRDFKHRATDNFLLSYFIAKNWDKLADNAFMRLFKSDDECYLKKDDITQVLKEVFLKFINDNVRLQSFFETFIQHSNFTAAIVGEIAYLHVNQRYRIDREIIKDVFVKLCDKYKEDITLCECKYFNDCKGKNIENCKGEIKLKFEIGKVVGKLLIAEAGGVFLIDRELIKDKLACFFNVVADDHVVPQVNKYRISVNPITNFEYEKFQRDQVNYVGIKNMPNAEKARERYYQIYSAIFDFIKKASIIHPKNQESRSKLAKILKGVDWLHYSSLVEVINSLANKSESGEYKQLKEVFKEYYPDSISRPVMWRNPYDCNAMFCNPLQPVVGLSLAEAMAYANWLEGKTGKSVKIVENSDYMKIVGLKKSSDYKSITFFDKSGNIVSENDTSLIIRPLNAQRLKFIKEYNSKGVRSFNCRNNFKCFYGMDVTSEPTTIGLFPNNKIEGLFDFCGNVFEMIATHYDGNGVQDGRPIDDKNEDFSSWEEMYNCGGGGWQHKDDKFPPKYMGQFTGFTRNQDIGFRIVIDRDESDYSIKIKEKQKKSKQKKSMNSIESSIHIYTKHTTICDRSLVVSLDGVRITNPPSEKNETPREYYSIGKVFSKDPCHQLCFYGRQNQPEILLVSKDVEIFAYKLTEMVSAPISKSIEQDPKEESITVIKREHTAPEARSDEAKEFSNCDMADIFQAIIWHGAEKLSIFTAKPIDITSGYFRIKESTKTDSNEESLWYIRYRDTQNKTLFDTIKSSLAEKWYMPDWVDLFLLLDVFKDKQPITLEPVVIGSKVNKMMTILSIIDTAEMHMSIYNSTDKSQKEEENEQAEKL